MISFRTKNDSASSTLLILSAILLVGTAAWFSRPLPMESIKPSAQTQKKADIDRERSEAAKANADTEAKIAPRVWTGTIDKVQPQAFTIITDLAKKHSLKLVNIHPAKSVDGQGVTEVPFGVTLDGPFTNAVQFVKDLEQPDLKLAVRTVQVAAADTGTDHVTETLNVVAYLKAAATTPATTGDKNAKKPK